MTRRELVRRLLITASEASLSHAVWEDGANAYDFTTNLYGFIDYHALDYWFTNDDNEPLDLLTATDDELIEAIEWLTDDVLVNYPVPPYYKTRVRVVVDEWLAKNKEGV